MTTLEATALFVQTKVTKCHAIRVSAKTILDLSIRTSNIRIEQGGDSLRKNRRATNTILNTSMPAPTPSKVNPELVSVWLEHFQQLDVLIETSPDDSSVWIWTVRQKILAFLLHRYGPQTQDSSAPQKDSAARSVNPGLLATKQRPTQAPHIDAGFAGDAPPRGAASFRGTLDHLRRLNAARYVSAHLDRPICLTYPATGHTLPNEHLFDQQRLLIQQDIDAITDLIPEGQTLTEEQIVAILSGKPI